MDCGLMEPEYERFDPWKPRLPEEIIGVMDRLLCNKVPFSVTFFLFSFFTFLLLPFLLFFFLFSFLLFGVLTR